MKTYKVNSFAVDKNLGYLIQQITKDPTQEVLAYFYGIMQFVLGEKMKKSSANWISINIILFYKDTPISYNLKIEGNGPGFGRDVCHFRAAVKFPGASEEFQVDELMTSVLETGLGLAEVTENMKPFARPELKTPKSLKEVRLKQELERS